MADISGYVKLHRSILDWEWYQDANTARVFFHLLFKANYKNKSWRGQEIRRGQLVTSINSLCTELSLSTQAVRTALNHLKKTGEIKVQVTNKYSVITVENYTLYQDDEVKSNKQANSLDNRQVTSNQQATNKQLTTTKERKKERKKEGKNNNNSVDEIIAQCPEELRECISAFVEMRKSIKAPVTAYGLKKLINKAHKMAGGRTDIVREIFDQSTANSWKGVFELKQQRGTAAETFADLLREELEHEQDGSTESTEPTGGVLWTG